MASDLVGGRYPVTYPFAKALGLAANASQGNITIRSNGELLGLGNAVDGALAATEVGCVVAVPVEAGDLISKVTILVGATKGKKVEAGFAAVYAGTNAKNEPKEGALLAQSKSAALAEGVLAEEPLVFTLETPVLVTTAIAPFGFVYVMISLEAETMPSALTQSTPKALQAVFAKQFPNAGLLSATAGAAQKTKAPATLPALTSKAVAPLVFLS
jgi:hypothetical protein